MSFAPRPLEPQTQIIIQQAGISQGHLPLPFDASGIYTKAEADSLYALVAHHHDTVYATKAELAAEVAALVGSSPAALDTLQELANALGDDPNFATTVTNQIAGKAPLTHSHTWGQITGKPSSFPPSSHSHDYLPLSGGILSGKLGVNGTTSGGQALNVTNTTAGELIARFGNDVNGELSRVRLQGRNAAGTLKYADIILDPASNDLIFNSPHTTERLRLKGAGGDVMANGEFYTGAHKHWHGGNFDPASKANASHTHTIANVSGLQDEIDSSRRFQTLSNFTNGTLITTSISQEATSWLLDIKGKSYASRTPHAILAEGYNYNGSITNSGGINLSGSTIETLDAFLMGGVLCFWIPPTPYWNSLAVRVTNTKGAGPYENLVVSVTNTARPTSGLERETTIPLKKSWHSDNFDPASKADASHSHTWASITSKPTTFAPSAHTHTVANVTGLQAALDGKQASGSYAAASHSHTWAQVTGKPTTFAPAAHTHAVADVTGLQAALDGKQASGSYSLTTHSHTWAQVTGKPTTFAPAAHTHTWAQVTGKPTTFAPAAHSHSFGSLTGVTVSTAAPSGGVDGDIWFQV